MTRMLLRFDIETNEYEKGETVALQCVKVRKTKGKQPRNVKVVANIIYMCNDSITLTGDLKIGEVE